MGSFRNRRRRVALATCILWLLAVELLPNLHLAAHRNDHTHAADGTIVDHGDHQHHVVAAEPAKRPVKPALAITGPVGRGHHATGIAHRAVALHVPPPVLFAPLAAPTSTAPPIEPGELTPSPRVARPSARGPPRAA